MVLLAGGVFLNGDVSGRPGVYHGVAPARDRATDVTGQAAVRERDAAVPLQDHDLGRLIEPPPPCPVRAPAAMPRTITVFISVTPVRQDHAHVVYWILPVLVLRDHPSGGDCHLNGVTPETEETLVTDVTIRPSHDQEPAELSAADEQVLRDSPRGPARAECG
jgi:hypothetical protein